MAIQPPEFKPTPLPASARAQEVAQLAIIEAVAAGKPVPSLRNLAARAEVSLRTMWKAMALLKAEGKVPMQPRAFGNKGPRKTKAQSPAQRVTHLLAHDCLSGHFPMLSRLPPLKNLADRYASTSRTVAKALSQLKAAGLIEPMGRSYRPAAPHHQHLSTPVILLIHRGEDQPDEGLYRLTVNRSDQLIMGIETECSRIGVRLVQIRTDFEPNSDIDINTQDPGVLTRKHFAGAVLGTIIWGRSMSAEAITECMLAALALQLPTVIIEENGNFSLPASITKLKRCVHFSISNSSLCGRAMGRHLMEAGHSQVAYICPFFDGLWTQRRYSGLCESFAAGAENAKVHAVVQDEGNTNGTLREVTGEIWNRWQPRIPSFLSSPTPEIDSDDIANLIRETIKPIWYEMVYLSGCTDLFEKALALDSVSCWVCSQDRVAMAALRFLQRKGVALRSRPGVAGFDDSYGAAYQRLTSYNFDIPGLTRTCIACITGPSTILHELSQENRDYPGFVSVRESTLLPQPAHVTPDNARRILVR